MKQDTLGDNGPGSSKEQTSALDPLRNVDPDDRDRYLKLLEDKEQLSKLEADLDECIADVENGKREIFLDPSNADYAYVTYEDLQLLPFWRQEQAK